MNKLYGSLVKIGFVTTALLGVHFYPDYWIHIFAAVPAAFLVDFANCYSRKYESLKGLQKIKERYREYRLKKELEKIIKREEYEKYQKKLIENALENAKSGDENKRKRGLEQLSKFGEEDAYKKLLEILKNNGLNKPHENQIVETLCKIFSNMKNIDKW